MAEREKEVVALAISLVLGPTVSASAQNAAIKQHTRQASVVWIEPVLNAERG